MYFQKWELIALNESTAYVRMMVIPVLMHRLHNVNGANIDGVRHRWSSCTGQTEPTWFSESHHRCLPICGWVGVSLPQL